MERLRRILPATTGRAVDARALDLLVRGDRALADRLEGYVNLFFTRFEGRIEGGERALRVAGGQVGALIAMIDAALGMVEGRHLPLAAALLHADALGTACAARALAEVDRSADPDVAFAVGFCRHLGRGLLLADDPDAQLRWWRTARRARGLRRRAAAEDLLGPRPRVEGARALDELGVPEVLLDALVGHEVEALPEPFQQVVGVVDQAEALVEALGAADAAVGLHGWVEAAAASPGIPAEGAWQLVQDVLDTVPRAGAALGVDVHPWSDLGLLRRRRGRVETVDSPDELAVLAALQQGVLEHQRRALDTLRDELRLRLRVDPATDLLTFQAFCGRLAGALADPATSLSTLVVVDVLGFGTLFARHGLRTTDRILARIATTLDKVFDDTDLITRCGPASFVLAVPAPGRMARVQLERARVAIERLEVPGADGPIRVDVDLGMLDLAEVPLDVRAEALIEAARRTVGPPAAWSQGA